MAKRGRPSKNGKIRGWMFARALRVLEEFDRARATMKYSSAVTLAVENYRKLYPTVPMSEQILRRITARYRGKQDPMALIPVTKSDEELKREKAEILRLFTAAANAPGYSDDEKRQADQFLAAFRNMNHGARIRFGLRPEYPRANAKTV